MDEDKVLNPGCAYRDDLISIVYGEATEPETRKFQQHMRACLECSEDYAAFKGIRNSVFSWRQETLGFITQPERSRQVRDRSALAAVREFFTLSPLWLRGAVALASLVFCLLAVLAVSRSRTDPTPVIISSKTDAEIEKMVESRTQERLATLKEKEGGLVPAGASEDEIKAPKSENKRVRIPATQVAVNPTRKPLTKKERDQLAADLRLTASEDDSDIGLLDEGYNR